MSNTQISQNEKKARQHEILKKIRRGWSRKRLVQWVVENYELSYSYAWKQVADCYAMLAEINKDYVETVRDVQLERIESILAESIESGDRQSSLKAIDLINKIFSLYVEKKDLNITGNDISFKLD